MIHSTRSARFFTLFWLLMAALALLSIGALQKRQQFLSRGLPAGLPEPVAHAGVEPALNVYLSAYTDAELAQQLTEIKQIGIRYLKQPFYFSPDFDWEAADRLFTAVADHGLQLVPLLDGNPADQFAPPSLTQFAAWAGQFATRYAAQTRYYIIWDEPNLSSHWGNQPVNPATYAALLQASAYAIRQADADAVIVAAPLAPTSETGPQNLADALFLQQLYEEGAAEAFDVVAAKPYGFGHPATDRTVSLDHTNFSRAILLREVMLANNDGRKAVWAGNWGWNSLPSGWSGAPSIWGDVSEADQAHLTQAALERARREWPWMGLMFLENWQPDAPADDPLWGFSIAGRATAVALQQFQAQTDPTMAWPGFYIASPEHLAQQYQGHWQFSPEFGADASQYPEDQLLGDRLTFTFWGTDVGLRVRRADFRARLYVTIDGQPANALPHDENGATLVLTAADPSEDYISLEWVGRNLEPGPHVLELVTSRGWDQWLLHGLSVAYHDPATAVAWHNPLLVGVMVLAVGLAVASSRRAAWGEWLAQMRQRYHRLDNVWQWTLTAVAALLLSLGGWLTWGEQFAGIYRRLGDGSQFVLMATTAVIFYVSPSFLLTAVSLLLLLTLITFRPIWGLVLVAFCFPFYVYPVLKPIFHYRFSPVEVFMMVTFAAFCVQQFATWVRQQQARLTGNQRLTSAKRPFVWADAAVLLFFGVATVSIFFAQRADVASNEWRMVILGPTLFYVVFRGTRPSEQELWWIVDAFVGSGLAIALVGLWQYAFDHSMLITAEGGLMRIRAFYGSPNNVGLYLGRVIPFLLAMLLLGNASHGRRRYVYAWALVPIGLACLLTFSKGAIFLGIPTACLFIFWQWQRRHGRLTWPWVAAFAGLGVGGLLLIEQIPILAGRLGLFGETGVFRLNLWRASLNIIREHPIWGVGLDNFLYAHRGRYIFDEAWREPNLSHPHNLFFDFATRLGLLGLFSGLMMLTAVPVTLWRNRGQIPAYWLPLWVGCLAAFIDMVVHGMVDHTFFLVDMAFIFYFLLATAVWLSQKRQTS